MEIIYFEPESNSFKWATGLYAILEIDGNEIKIIKLNKNGELSTYEDGSLNIMVTGINNKGVIKTNLIYEFV